MPTIKKRGNKKCWRGCGEKKEPSFTAGRNLTGTAAMENGMAVPPKIKNRVTI